MSIRRACGVLELAGPHTITNSVAPIRPASKPGSRKSAQRACATAIGACTSCCVAKAGTTNIKKAYRIYRELGLQLRNKTPKLRDDRKPATAPNETWAMDFVHDQLATGKKICVLTVVDTLSRFSPVVDPRFSYRAEDVVGALERVCASIGYPKTIRVDQGSEFVSRDMDLWAYARGVTLDFSRPGKPTNNAFIETFSGRFRPEFLNAHWFLTLDDARLKMEEWRRY